MISVSVKTKYALAALVALAMSSGQEAIQIRQLAQNCDIPAKYLEQVLNTLKKSGFVNSLRGHQGGYRLATDPSQITVAAIMRALETGAGLSSGYCGCQTLSQFWSDSDQSLNDLFDISIAQLVSRKQKADQLLTYAI